MYKCINAVWACAKIEIFRIFVRGTKMRPGNFAIVLCCCVRCSRENKIKKYIARENSFGKIRKSLLETTKGNRDIRVIIIIIVVTQSDSAKWENLTVWKEKSFPLGGCRFFLFYWNARKFNFSTIILFCFCVVCRYQNLPEL